MPKVRKKHKSQLDELARMVQRGFDGVDKRFDAVDKRLDATQDHVDVLTEGVRILRADTEAGFQAVTATMKSLVEQIHGVRADVVEVHDLRVRLERLEKKVGLRGDSRAAA